MESLLALIPAIPFLSFLILSLTGLRLAKPAMAALGVGSVGISAIISVILALSFFTNSVESFEVVLWQWMDVAGFSPEFAFKLDALSLAFTLVITIIGFLIHLYSAEFMYEEQGFGRFFAAMNLFISAMLILVMANNLALLYLGWEGVGLCSYLLIGFYYQGQANVQAAQKAFIVTRVGDTALGIGLFLLFANLGTLDLGALPDIVNNSWAEGDSLAIAASALLLVGAIGKSAQLPLQTWLPDAMAGPSPVSALIHAATMVTAGVYLIARTHFIFTLAPSVMTIIAVIGALTLLIAGLSALTQRDIKRVLAYSTISQIGYMFLALGVGAWSAGIFHFLVHGFFKALLFLGAGVVIHALHDEHDMFKMGGLRKQLPVTFWTFLIGASCLAAVPLITAGFYSKDAILWYSFASEQGSTVLWFAGFLGAIITAFYTFRMVFLTFFGDVKIAADHKPGNAIKIPLVILGILSLVGGFIETPQTLGGLHLFSGFLGSVLPSASLAVHGIGMEATLQLITAVAALLAIFAAYRVYVKGSLGLQKIAEDGLGGSVHSFLTNGWQFDRLYDTLFVKPLSFIARINKADVIDKIFAFLAFLAKAFHYLLSLTQSGRLRWYAAGLAVGAVLTLTIIVFL